jgi:hypothetical protein
MFLDRTLFADSKKIEQLPTVVRPSSTSMQGRQEQREPQKSTPVPRNDNLKQIIRNFELKTEAVYQASPAPKVYVSPSAQPSPRATADALRWMGIILFSILLTMPALVVGCIYLAGRDVCRKKQGILMIVLSVLFSFVWIAAAILFWGWIPPT